MKCPLIPQMKYTTFELIESQPGDCLKEECAWYYKENQSCSMLTLAQGSTYIHKVLLAIERTQTHERLV